MCGRITTNAVNWAAANEVVSGYGNGRFGVNDNVTRQDVAAILWRQEGRPAANVQDFVDESSIASYAATAVDWARANGIISGKGGNRFDPRGNATRAEIAAMMKNYIEYKESTEPTPPTPPTPSGSKTLVVYFSATGSTERVAGYIAGELDADTFELIPSNPYTSEDLNWTTPGSRVNREHEDESLRNIPLVQSTVSNWDDYDTVFIGYPIWWGIAAWPVNNFITANDFIGKKCMLNAYDHLSSKDSIAYEEPQGFSDLRHILGGYLYLSRGVKCSTEQIIFTSDHQQSMHIIANLFRPADWGGIGS